MFFNVPPAVPTEGGELRLFYFKMMPVFAASGKTRFLIEILENLEAVVDLTNTSGTVQRGAAVCEKGALLPYL